VTVTYTPVTVVKTGGAAVRASNALLGLAVMALCGGLVMAKGWPFPTP